jgi:hypothetical protein
MFFAPLVAPPPPAPAHVVVVSAPAPVAAPVMTPRLTPSGPLAQAVTVPASYQFGACQAVHYIAWDLGWHFAGQCTKYNRVAAVPLRFGAQAPAGEWLSALAQQLPAGSRVVVDATNRSIAVTP